VSSVVLRLERVQRVVKWWFACCMSMTVLKYVIRYGKRCWSDGDVGRIRLQTLEATMNFPSAALALALRHHCLIV
jgi:hypothetical protein